MGIDQRAGPGGSFAAFFLLSLNSIVSGINLFTIFKLHRLDLYLIKLIFENCTDLKHE
jgi:hypothetical protein